MTARVQLQALGLEFERLLADIQTLNEACFQGKYEVSAVSFHAYAHLADKCLLLPHGSSMGDNYRPVVVARKDGPSTLENVKVAVPGLLTTPFLALRLYDPHVKYEVMPFDKIQDAVHDGSVQAGLLIHVARRSPIRSCEKGMVEKRVVAEFA